MNNMLLFTIVIFGGLIVGLMLTFIALFTYDSFTTYLKKRKLPKNMQDPLYENGGNIKIDEKEVKENERKQFTKYREFEKLRRIGNNQTKREVSRSSGTVSPSSRDAEPKGRDLLSNDANSLPKGTERNSKEDGELPEPTSI